MWVEDFDELSELFKGGFPYYLLIVLPLMIIISPVNPVSAAHEFPVYRMQQFDLHGLPHGCRSAPVNLEARSLTSWSTNRHCVVARLQDMTTQQLRDIRYKAGALLIVLPKNMNELSEELKVQLMEIEEDLMSQEIFIPVYFAYWTKELQEILDDVSTNVVASEKTGSAAEALLNSVSANGYQIIVSSSQSSPKSDVFIGSVQGKLSGQGVEDNLPTIAIVAHYDSFGVAPELSNGADSNGSGVAVLLELARIFSVLYSNSKTHARHNILFLLSGGGKLNFLGSKKWLEDQIDGLEGSLLQDASFILCLDTLSRNNKMYLHVSKPPKETSLGGLFYNKLKNVSTEYGNIVNIDMVHKKINLADDMLAWEHERYSIRRLPAFTLSTLKSHKDLHRGTIFDIKERVDIDRLQENTRVVAEALARHIYNTSDKSILSDHLGVESDSLKAIIEFLAAHPRSQQLISDKHNPFINALSELMSRYLKDVKVTNVSPDRRDPEVVFFDVTKGVVNVYSVKPAIFDLFLTIAIIVYLALVYFVLNNFSVIYLTLAKLVSSKKKVY